MSRFPPNTEHWRNMRRLTCTAIALLALAHPATAQISGDVVKIGVLTDMSGPFSDQTGRGSVAGAELAIEDFKGTVAGAKIELVVADHQNKADVGATIARRWFDTDGVDVVVDLASSAVALAVQDITRERNKVALFS